MQRTMIIDDIWKRRILVVTALLSLLFLAVFLKLIHLTIIQRPSFLNTALRQHCLQIELKPRRGDFLDRTGRELTTSLKVPSIYAIPRQLGVTDSLVDRLSEILSLDKGFLKERLSRDKEFVWLKRRVTKQEAEAIEAMGNSSVQLIYESQRFYPQGSMAAHVIGFCDIDNNGLEGLELGFDNYLKGQTGYRVTQRDALGRDIAARELRSVPAVDGGNIVLTLDQFVQHVVERELDKAYAKWNAKGAVAIVMTPYDGGILAMATRPTYDLNEFAATKPDVRRNRAVTDFFEPGSVFKIVTASAALSEGTFTLDDKIDCEEGSYDRNGFILHDVHPYGKLTFPEVFINSSNIGTVKIAEELGPDVIERYVKRFGFSKKTDVDIPGEVSGFIRQPAQWSGTSIAAIPIGQEVTITALQLVTAMSAIANGGKLVRPYIVKEVRDAKGVTLKRTFPKIRDYALSPEVAAKVKDILVRVVKEGTGQNADLYNVAVAGKTGTAQKVNPETKAYSHTLFTSCFIGFAPADEPLFSMVVVVDEPRPQHYGATVAAPVFRAVAREILPYLGHIEPAEKIRSEAS